MKIPLSRGMYTEVSPDWFEELSKYKWFARYSKSNNKFYASRNVGKFPNRKLEHMHRVIMNTPEGMDCDHINGDTLNNRTDNLRNCSRSENVTNSKLRSDNTSGYKGVHKTSHGRWCVRIVKNGETKFQRNFSNLLEAVRMYDTQAKLHFGEYAVLNFPNGEE